MGVANVPAASAGGGINSVQRGSAAASGNVTITAVDITKSFVTVFGSASSGTVSASFGLTHSNSTLTLMGTTVHGPNAQAFRYPASGSPTDVGTSYRGNNATNTGFWTMDRTITRGDTNVNAGSNNLVAAQVTGFLADSTTLTVSGACRFEVVEFA